MLKRILHELKTHAPFTLFGAATGIVLMVLIVVARVRSATIEPAFLLFHAGHVFLSAIVTAGMYRRYRKGLLAGILVGFVGSVGIATLSDVVFPHHGGLLMLRVTGVEHRLDAQDAEAHEDRAQEAGHEERAREEEEAREDPGHEGHERDMHIAFIDHWWLINPLALIGVAIGLWKPMTKVPHAGHVLLSTWASLFYLVAYGNAGLNWLPLLPLVFVVLFVAVWLPCCVSDIVFPLLFVGKEGLEEGHHHGHSH